MSSKYLFTKLSQSFPINNLDIESIKQYYDDNLDRNEIKRKEYFYSIAVRLGFRDWSHYRNEYENEIIPFLKKHNMKDYAPSENKNILKAEHEIAFSYRQISDRLFLSDKSLPKAIFTGYGCLTDMINFHINVLVNDNNLHEITTLMANNDLYDDLLKKTNLDLLIPMNVSCFISLKNLIGDVFVNNENQNNDEIVSQLYEGNKGLYLNNSYTEAAKQLKKILLNMSKGWIEVIPYNDNLIFLKALDGTYDFVFKNLRADKHYSPYGKNIKHKYIPPLLNEDYDFERWLYFGYKEKKKSVKEIKVQELWKERDEHLAEIHFYENNTMQNYPGSLQILKIFYIEKGLYSYEQKYSSKELMGFEKIELQDKIIFVSQLITIKEFFEFYTSGYDNDRYSELENLETINLEPEETPVSVTWYDAIAYCRYFGDKFDVPMRLLKADEFQMIAPKIENEQRMDSVFLNENSIQSELEFFYRTQKLPSPPPYMADFDNVIMKLVKPLEYIEKSGLMFCQNTIFKEWTNNFIDGDAETFSVHNNGIYHPKLNSYLASSTNKYKYMKIGFRVCYEYQKATK